MLVRSKGRKSSASWACLALGIFASSATAQTAWQSHSSPERCAVSAMVPGAAPSFLMFEGAPGGSLRLVIAAKELPRLPKGERRSPVFPAEIVPEGAGAAISVYGFPRQLSGALPNAVMLSGIGLGDIDALTKAATFSVRFKDGMIGPLAPTDLPAGMQTFRRCIAERLVALGADPAQFAAGGTPTIPLSDPERWLSNEQAYQIARAARGANVDLRFKVIIDARGSVSACSLLSGSKEADVEALGCKPLLGRTLAKPATDAQGRPVVGVLTFPVMVVRTSNAVEVR